MQILSRDSVTVSVDAVVYYRVTINCHHFNILDSYLTCGFVPLAYILIIIIIIIMIIRWATPQWRQTMLRIIVTRPTYWQPPPSEMSSEPSALLRSLSFFFFMIIVVILFDVEFLGKPYVRIMHVQTAFCQIAFQPPAPQANGGFVACIFRRKLANSLKQRFWLWEWTFWQ